MSGSGYWTARARSLSTARSASRWSASVPETEIGESDDAEAPRATSSSASSWSTDLTPGPSTPEASAIS